MSLKQESYERSNSFVWEDQESMLLSSRPGAGQLIDQTPGLFSPK